MNELLDKFILRIFFTLLLCGLIYLYKHIHFLIYPSTNRQLLKSFNPLQNPPEIFHLFSRIVGIAIIFSNFNINTTNGIFWALCDVLIQGVSGLILYIAAVYIIESIVLYNFDYSDEILKRKNFPFALINSIHALGIALVIQSILKFSQESLVLLFFLWLFATVVIGLTIKLYKYVSILTFDRLLHKKNLAIGFSYSGFFLGISVLVIASLNDSKVNLNKYFLMVVLKIILALIILPIVQRLISITFNLHKVFDKKYGQIHGESLVHFLEDPEIGFGIYEGALFFASSLLTSVIIGRISFGNFYPSF